MAGYMFDVHCLDLATVEWQQLPVGGTVPDGRARDSSSMPLLLLLLPLLLLLLLAACCAARRSSQQRGVS